MVKIDLAEDMVGTIGEVEVGDSEDEVVAAGLVEHFLCEGYILTFAFYDDEWVNLRIVYDYVAASGHAVECDGAFDLD